MKNLIFNRLDKIELRTKKMAHHIDEIKDQLMDWQDGKLKDSFFMEVLNKYWDEINN